MMHRFSPLLGSSGVQESEDEALQTATPPEKKRNPKQQAKHSQDQDQNITTNQQRRRSWVEQAKRPQTSPHQHTGSVKEKDKPKRGHVPKQLETHRFVSPSVSDSEPQSGISKATQKTRGRPKKIRQALDISKGSGKEFKTGATKKINTRKRQNDKHIQTQTASDLENEGVPAKRAKKPKGPTSQFSKSATSPKHSLSDLEDSTGQQNFESSSPDLEDDRSRGSSKSEHWDELVKDNNVDLSKTFKQRRISKHIPKDSSSSSELGSNKKPPVKRPIKRKPKLEHVSQDSKKSEKGEGMRSKTGPIECKVCSRLIRCKAVMERHMLTHTGEKPFECYDCGRRYTSSSNLRIHQRSHTGKMDYSCEQCGQKFTHLSYLKRHLLRHSDKRQHMCDQCGKGFFHKYHLERHLLVHSGKMPYACDKCDATFNRTDYLSLHMRNVHLSEDGEREMKAKPNKPFKCDICEKAFTTGTSLESHRRVHTGVTPYTCAICQRKFKQSSQMNAHVRTHSGEKPHTCDVCGIKFSRKNYVRIHKEKKHLANNVFQQS
ncbi:zinc finger protein 37-like [Astyanax mexicanus]|uniref:Zinc finger protein 37-like n=1 Tax=Astyanax mexicanus TaxID=7994 RepID=A0A8T2LTM4_ASTMX|nr:zinc finger protein 37-like [Astyanax mexicanus]